jgi:solute carrier family 25 protein 39/40
VVKTIQGHSSLLRQIFASSAGSIISTLSLNPIAVVKVRLQNLPAFAASSSGSGVISAEGSPLRSVIRTIIAQGGIGGFWAGTRTGIIMSVPNTVLYMSVYEKLKEVLTEEPKLKSIRAVTPALAGALARLVSVTIISPLELVRTIQTGGAKESLGTIARSIVQKEGIRGMYRGL